MVSYSYRENLWTTHGGNTTWTYLYWEVSHPSYSLQNITVCLMQGEGNLDEDRSTKKYTIGYIESSGSNYFFIGNELPVERLYKKNLKALIQEIHRLLAVEINERMKSDVDDRFLEVERIIKMFESKSFFR